jgi:hypothetical protein
MPLLLGGSSADLLRLSEKTPAICVIYPKLQCDNSLGDEGGEPLVNHIADGWLQACEQIRQTAADT